MVYVLFMLRTSAFRLIPMTVVRNYEMSNDTVVVKYNHTLSLCMNGNARHKQTDRQADRQTGR